MLGYGWSGIECQTHTRTQEALSSYSYSTNIKFEIPDFSNFILIIRIRGVNKNVIGPLKLSWIYRYTFFEVCWIERGLPQQVGGQWSVISLCKIKIVLLVGQNLYKQSKLGPKVNHFYSGMFLVFLLVYLKLFKRNTTLGACYFQRFSII